MTLMHTIASMRNLALHLSALEAWPEYTVLGATDVWVVGTSMVQVEERTGTPCVRTAAAPLMSTGAVGLDRPAHTRFVSVVVTRVQSILPHAAGDGRDVWVDAELDGCVPVLSECRVIGRRSSTRTQRVHLRPMHAQETSTVLLPRDLAIGDLIAFPCAEPAALHDLRFRGA